MHHALVEQAPDGATVLTQFTVRLDNRTRPEPDLIVTSADFPEDATMVEAMDVLLPVEVVSRVRGSADEHELRMTVLVNPNGTFGSLYMAAIAPFRYLIVYLALTQRWERAWRERRRLEGDR